MHLKQSLLPPICVTVWNSPNSCYMRNGYALKWASNNPLTSVLYKETTTACIHLTELAYKVEIIIFNAY